MPQLSGQCHGACHYLHRHSYKYDLWNLAKSAVKLAPIAHASLLLHNHFGCIRFCDSSHVQDTQAIQGRNEQGCIFSVHTHDFSLLPHIFVTPRDFSICGCILLVHAGKEQRLRWRLTLCNHENCLIFFPGVRGHTHALNDDQSDANSRQKF